MSGGIEQQRYLEEIIKSSHDNHAEALAYSQANGVQTPYPVFRADIHQCVQGKTVQKKQRTFQVRTQ